MGIRNLGSALVGRTDKELFMTHRLLQHTHAIDSAVPTARHLHLQGPGFPELALAHYASSVGRRRKAGRGSWRMRRKSHLLR